MRMRWHRNLLIGATLSLVFVTIIGSKSYATDNVKLLSSDGYYEDYFGRAVSISGDVVLVGAYKGGEYICASSGTAYIFRHNGSSWIQ